MFDFVMDAMEMNVLVQCLGRLSIFYASETLASSPSRLCLLQLWGNFFVLDCTAVQHIDEPIWISVSNVPKWGIPSATQNALQTAMGSIRQGVLLAEHEQKQNHNQKNSFYVEVPMDEESIWMGPSLTGWILGYPVAFVCGPSGGHCLSGEPLILFSSSLQEESATNDNGTSPTANHGGESLLVWAFSLPTCLWGNGEGWMETQWSQWQQSLQTAAHDKRMVDQQQSSFSPSFSFTWAFESRSVLTGCFVL